MQGLLEDDDSAEERLSAKLSRKVVIFAEELVASNRQIGVDDHQPPDLSSPFWVLLKLKEPQESLIDVQMRLVVQYHSNEKIFLRKPPTKEELSKQTLLKSLLISLKIIEPPTIFYADLVSHGINKAIGQNILNPTAYYFLATLFQTGQFVQRNIHLAVEYYAKCIAVEAILEKQHQSELYEQRFTAACEEAILYLRNNCDFSKIRCSDTNIPGYLHYLTALAKWCKHPQAIEKLISAGNVFLVNSATAESFFSKAYIFSAKPVIVTFPMPRWWLTSVDMKPETWEKIYGDMHRRAELKCIDLCLTADIQTAFEIIMTLSMPTHSLTTQGKLFFLYLLQKNVNDVVGIVINKKEQCMQYKIYIDLLKVIVAFDNTPVPVGSGHRLLVDLRERALQDLDEYYNSNSFYLLSKPDFTATNITDDTLLNISLMELSEKETMKALSEYTLLKQFIKVFTDNIPDMEKDYYNFKKNCALISLSRLKKRDELSVHDEPSTAAKEDRYSLIANMP